ncbi:hypothetical protein EDM80_12845 [bacterium]|nr:MAG: hypothetical protein EDM80_12845 [bacterium]RIK59699.1 MAG: hypothetical protein DCC64_15505 [Planctomycetota bacterium]
MSNTETPAAPTPEPNRETSTVAWYDFAPLIKPAQMVRLKGSDKRLAFEQLVASAARALGLGASQQVDLSAAVQAREAALSTQLGPGWAAPHCVMDVPERLTLVVGRSRAGIDFGRTELGRVHLVFLFVSGPDGHDEYLRAISSLARAFRDSDRDTRISRVLAADTPARLAAALSERVERGRLVVSRKLPAVTRALIRHLLKFAEDIEAEVILLFADVFTKPEELAPLITRRVVLASRATSLPESLVSRAKGYVRLAHDQLSHESAFQLAMLHAGARGLTRGGLVVSACGDKGSDDLDSIRIERPDLMFLRVMDKEGREIVMPEVLERSLEIAVELAEQGREGSPVGLVMVLGDYEQVKPLTQQLTINPFRGYPENERSLLDPALEETVKEFAAIDGAFIVAGNGVIQSAGTYLSPPAEVRVELVSGLGTRHRVAAALSKATEAIVIVLSQSTGRVTVYRQGREVMAVTPPRARIEYGGS